MSEAEELARELVTLTLSALQRSGERDAQMDRAFAEATASPRIATMVIEELALLCCHAMATMGKLVVREPEIVLQEFLRAVTEQQLEHPPT